jgi:cation transport ATPase
MKGSVIMAKAKTGVEVLQAMEWIIDNVGWCQGALFRDKGGQIIYGLTKDQYTRIGSVCLTGAMRLVDAKEGTAIYDAIVLFKDANKNLGFVRFNDEPKRTKEQVIAALRKAIKKGSK